MASAPESALAPRPFLGLEVPRPLRALVRARESSLAILGALVGALAGLVVAAMSLGVSLLHTLLFAVPPGQRLSSMSTLDPYVALAVPSLGGLLFGVGVYALVRWRPLREVDPIEATRSMAGACRCSEASACRCRPCGRAGSALRSAWKPAIRSWQAV